ncbi:MAG: tetratricopeptide repeat protein [Candidatus Latescibacteria bacterium]|nr:tetratricopeptide repeat protein [Candidatus Latescibacterota bacterium]
MIEIAGVHSQLNEFNEAESYFLRALKITENFSENEPSYIAFVMIKIAQFYSKFNKYMEAEMLLIRTVDILQKIYEPNDYKLGTTLCELAAVKCNLSKYIEAELLYEKSLKIFGVTQKTLKDSFRPGQVISYIKNYRDMLKKTGKNKKAEKMQRVLAKLYQNYIQY